MGRKRTNEANDHFTYYIDEDYSVCNYCTQKIKGKHSANLERHLKSKHKTEYENFRKKNIDSASTSKQAKLETYGISNNVKVKLSQNELIDACVDLVTVNGRPLTIFSDSGMQKILHPMFEALDSSFITKHNINKHIEERALKIKNNIKDNLRNRLLCLKIDCVTRLNRSIMGINVQYIDNAKIVICTLAMSEIKTTHTAEHLKDLLIQSLMKFNIEKSQIYTITTDNGSNMLKMVKLLQKENINVDDEKEDESSDEIDDVTEDINVDINENLSLQHTIDELQDSLLSSDQFSLITQVRCAAHTLQLAVNDALKIPMSCIAKARQICKKLRTSTFIPLLQKFNLKKPVIDCPTRWSSTYDMLQRLIELRSFCIDFAPSTKDLHLSVNEWESIKSVVLSLKPAKEATLFLQRSQITIGDFYGIWWKCVNATKKVDTPLARSLIEALTTRQKMLFENEIFVSAMFLDPRYQCMLSKENKDVAKKHLTDLRNQLLILKKNECEQRNYSSGVDKIDSSLSESEDTDELESMLCVHSQQNIKPNKLNDRNILNVINSFDNIQREHHNINILNYWEEQKTGQFSELYQLSQIVFSVPATQVSVERSFSSLKYILSDLRNSLTDEILENILIIRGNC